MINPKNLAASVIQGEHPPLEAYTILKGMLTDVEDAISAIKEDAISELKKYGKDGFVSDGMRFQVRDSAGVWRYNSSEIWKQKKMELDEIQNAMKAAYKTPGMIIDENGEIIEPATFEHGRETIYATKKK
jgi:hypothetical protein